MCALVAGVQTCAVPILTALPENFKASWLFDELDRSRSFGAAIHKFGALIGGTINWIEQNIFGGKAPWSIRDLKKDHETLKLAKDSEKIIYPKPDGTLSFDKLSSVFVSSTNHEEEDRKSVV